MTTFIEKIGVVVLVIEGKEYRPLDRTPGGELAGEIARRLLLGGTLDGEQQRLAGAFMLKGVDEIHKGGTS